MTDKVEVTDRINEILSEYDGNESDMLLNDIDSWGTHDIQELLDILDNEIMERCNRATEIMG